VIRSGIAKPGHQVKVILSNFLTGTVESELVSTLAAIGVISARWIMVETTIGFVPRIQRIPHPTDGMFPSKDFSAFKLNHSVHLPFPSACL
jgi:hypothetical protein